MSMSLYNPMNFSPPGSSVHRLLQEKILEWVAIPFSRVSFSGKRSLLFLTQGSNPSPPHLLHSRQILCHHKLLKPFLLLLLLLSRFSRV